MLIGTECIANCTTVVMSYAMDNGLDSLKILLWDETEQ